MDKLDQVEQQEQTSNYERMAKQLEDNAQLQQAVGEKLEFNTTLIDFSQENQIFLKKYFSWSDYSFLNYIVIENNNASVNINTVISAMRYIARLSSDMDTISTEQQIHTISKFVYDAELIARDMILGKIQYETIEFFGPLFSPPGMMGRDHLLWFDQHKLSRSICEKLSQGNYTINFRGTQVPIGYNKKSVHFIRGLILSAERNLINPSTDFATLVETYNRELGGYLEQSPVHYDTCLYVRDDSEAFIEPLKHRKLYGTYASSLKAYTGSDIVTQLTEYITTHTNESILLYLGGHGDIDGVTSINGNHVSKQEIATLAAYPNVTLEIDSCRAEKKLANDREDWESRGMLLSSSSEVSYSSFDITKLGALDWVGQLPDAYSVLGNDAIKNLANIGLLGEGENKWFLRGIMDDFEISRKSNGTEYILPDRHLPSISQRNSLLDISKRYSDAVITLQNSIGTVNLKMSQLSYILKNLQRQTGDFNKDGKVDFVENRFYIMQWYHDSFLPTSYNSGEKHIQIASIDNAYEDTNSSLG